METTKARFTYFINTDRMALVVYREAYDTEGDLVGEYQAEARLGVNGKWTVQPSPFASVGGKSFPGPVSAMRSILQGAK